MVADHRHAEENQEKGSHLDEEILVGKPQPEKLVNLRPEKDYKAEFQ